MQLDPAIAGAGALVGFVVGLTGTGGGALTTPMLILLFGVRPAVAVGSDLLASLAMKLVGGGVHLRHGTVRTDLVRWLCVGSIPGVAAGLGLLHLLGPGRIDAVIQHGLGVALLLVASTLVLRPWLRRRRVEHVGTRRSATVAAGAVAGVAVGVTSVGSGSLIVAALALLYPRLTAAEVVGTDLVQAALLVGAAAFGHVLFGTVHLGLVASLLAGSLPGTYLGARISARAPERVLRPALLVALVATGVKLI